MKFMKKNRLLFVVFIAFFSCVSTELTSIKNPKYRNVHFTKILINSSFQDLKIRQDTENYFVSEFNKYNLNAIRSIDLIPPIKSYSIDDIKRILSENQIDAIMTINIIDAYSDKVYIPETSTTKGTASIYGNTIYGESRTTTYGGYYLNKPRLKFDITVYNTIDEDIIWKATSFTAGNAYADLNMMLKSLAEEAVKKYVEDIKK